MDFSRRKSATKFLCVNLVFSDISFMAIFAEVTENERIGTCAVYILSLIHI